MIVISDVLDEADIGKFIGKRSNGIERMMRAKTSREGIWLPTFIRKSS